MQYAKLVDGQLQYPPKIKTLADGRTVINYDSNYTQLSLDGYKVVVSEPMPIVEGMVYHATHTEQPDSILVTWEGEPAPEPLPAQPIEFVGGIEVPVLILTSRNANKGIGLVASDEGDLVTYVDRESPRPSDEVIKARVAAALEAKRKLRETAVGGMSSNRLQERVENLERFLGLRT